MYAKIQLCRCPTYHTKRAVLIRSLRRRPYRMKPTAVGFISLTTVFPGEFGLLLSFRVGRSGKVGAAWRRPCGELGVALQHVGLVWCLPARVAWLLVVVVVGTLYLSGGDKYWICESLDMSAYIDPYLWVTCVHRGGPGASGGHVVVGAAVVMSSVPSYCWRCILVLVLGTDINCLSKHLWRPELT